MSFNFLLLLGLVSLVSAASRDQDVKDVKVPDNGFGSWEVLPPNDTSLVSKIAFLKAEILAQALIQLDKPPNSPNASDYHLHIQRGGILSLAGGTFYNASLDIDREEGGVKHGPVLLQCTVKFNTILTVNGESNPHLVFVNCTVPKLVKVKLDISLVPDNGFGSLKPLPPNDTSLASKLAFLRPEILAQALKQLDKPPNAPNASDYHLHIQRVIVFAYAGGFFYNVSLDIDREEGGGKHGPVLLQCTVTFNTMFTGKDESDPSLGLVNCTAPKLVKVKLDISLDNDLFTWLPLPPNDTSLVTKVETLKPEILTQALKELGGQDGASPVNASKYHLHITRGGIFRRIGGTSYNASLNIDRALPDPSEHGPAILVCTVNFAIMFGDMNIELGPFLRSVNCTIPKFEKVDISNDNDLFTWLPLPPNDTSLVSKVETLKPEILTKALKEIDNPVNVSQYHLHILAGGIYRSLGGTSYNASLEIDKPSPSGDGHGPVILKCTVKFYTMMVSQGAILGPFLESYNCEGSVPNVPIYPNNSTTDLSPNDTALTFSIAILKPKIISTSVSIIDPNPNVSHYRINILQGSVQKVQPGGQSLYLASIVVERADIFGLLTLKCQLKFSTFSTDSQNVLRGPNLDSLICKLSGNSNKSNDLVLANADSKDKKADVPPNNVEVPPNDPELQKFLAYLKPEIFTKAFADQHIHVDKAFQYSGDDNLGYVSYNVEFVIDNAVNHTKPLKRCSARVGQEVYPDAKPQLDSIKCSD